MADIPILNGGYKPTNITGGHHLVGGATSAPPAWCCDERDTRAMTPDLGIPRSQSRGVRAFPSILRQKRLARGELATHPSVVG